MIFPGRVGGHFLARWARRPWRIVGQGGQRIFGLVSKGRAGGAAGQAGKAPNPRSG